jgi:hypothetical protein
VKTLEVKMKALPPELRDEVEKFIELLIKKTAVNKKRKPSFKWEGALRDLQTKYSSVDLQHHIR